ncbi:TM1812 family CRISPR-associated protein [Helicobacter cetorum]|uniref:CRISPR-associated protein DxTHG motif protein n=1 Tax=Helicobacter cetorum (strain ATCC BAA-429 / MIT 00-7128) TaxID=182217 RepID=I0EP20_HELC0|nr:TM1812 family CRISPR-associated protein [Helicobacter cetorum]AFI04689.1 CRISPR-associated protein DxTHG motif protein [Helicobacter cetorum MIT 00-7128]
MNDNNNISKGRKAIITILRPKIDRPITYKIKTESGKYSEYEELYNMFGYFLETKETFYKDYDLIPLYTKQALTTCKRQIGEKEIQYNDDETQRLIITSESHNFIKEGYYIEDEEDEKGFAKIFSFINKILSSNKYNQVIVDVTHGFRHLPMLILVDLIIQNFQNTSKVEKILYAKTIGDEKENKYEIIDLKDYLDIANIMFVVSSFKHNFTTSNIEVSSKYSGFINSLCEVSNDLLSLNINHLTKQDGQGSANKLLKDIQKLQEELEKETQNKEHFLINPLKDLAEFVKGLINFEGKKYYQTYLELSEIFYERDYLINSIALLCESARYFIKTQLKRECSEDLTNKIESIEDNLDTYETLRFFSGLSRIAKNRDGNYIEDPRDPNSSQYLSKFAWSEERVIIRGKERRIEANEKVKNRVIKNTFQNRDSQNSDDYNVLREKCMAINGTLSKVSMLSDEIDDLRNKLVHINPNNDFDEIKKQINEKIERYKEIINEDTPTN